MADYVSKVATPTNPFGNFLLASRQDTPGDLAGTNLFTSIPSLDAGGSLRVTEEGGLATYFACSAFACDSTATDIWTFVGSASAVCKIQFLLISSVATAAATGRLQILRRSAANTAGTLVNPAIAKADSRNGTANGTPGHYTAHPTGLGASAGVILTQQFAQQAANAVPLQAAFLLDFRQYNGGQGLRLNGIAEILAINAVAALGGAGNAWDITCCWTESPTSA